MDSNDDLAPADQLVQVRKSTAEIHASPELARQLAGQHEIVHGAASHAHPSEGIAITARCLQHALTRIP